MFTLNLLQGVKTRERRRRKHIASTARWNRENPERRRAINASYYKTSEAIRRRDLLKAYGLSPEEFNKMAADQAFKCAICGKKPERLCVDHDHATGAVRGLLCHSCNLGLGKFGDDPALLLNALTYLQVR